MSLDLKDLHFAYGKRTVLEGPEIDTADVAVAEQEHAYEHALEELGARK